jgi:hypothetical protein
MAGKGMGMATRGGGCVGSGPKNKYVSKTSMKSGPVMMANGGMAVSPRKKMAMGMMGGGSVKKMRKGGMCK